MNASGATSIVPRSMYAFEPLRRRACRRARRRAGRRYGSTFASMSPGRKPSRSPASTAGRVRMMRADLALRQRRDGERHREVGLARAGRADPEGDRALADRVDVALLRRPSSARSSCRGGARRRPRRRRGCPRPGRARRGRRRPCPGRSRGRPRRARRARRRPRAPRRRAARRPRSSAGCRAAGSCSRAGRAATSSTPSPMPPSSAATSFETSRTSCTAPSVGAPVTDSARFRHSGVRRPRLGSPLGGGGGLPAAPDGRPGRGA